LEAEFDRNGQMLLETARIRTTKRTESPAEATNPVSTVEAKADRLRKSLEEEA